MKRRSITKTNLASLIRRSKSKGGRYKVSPKEDRTYDGIVFDSKWEAETFKLLKTLLPEDVFIHKQVNFLIQEKFKLHSGKTIREINYVADFVITRDKELIDNVIPDDAYVIDSKGHVTDVFKIKNKMFMYKYRTVIHQVKSAKDVHDVVTSYKLQ